MNELHECICECVGCEKNQREDRDRRKCRKGGKRDNWILRETNRDKSEREKIEIERESE